MGSGFTEKDSLSTRKSGAGGVTPGGGIAVGVPTVSVSGSPARRQASPQPISPPRRFDPFAPLDHNSGGSARVEEDAESNSYLYPTTSISRENRPANLYIPMPATVPVGGTGNTPTWPFTRTGSSAEHLFAAPLTSHAILSPSMIHPSYADDKTPTSSSSKRPIDPILTSTPSSNPTTGPTQKLYSAIPVSNTPDSDSDDARSVRERSARSRNTSSDSPKNSHKSTLPTNPSTLHLNSAGRHQPSYSLGTHALLSSRSPSSARIYAALDTPTAWLILYFSFNLGLTLFNKLVMKGFPFPWSLTGIQMLSGTIGTQIALSRGYFVQARLNGKESATMVAFSILYTVNIAVSNLSLHLVTVPVSHLSSYLLLSPFYTDEEGMCSVPSSCASYDTPLHHRPLRRLAQQATFSSDLLRIVTCHCWCCVCYLRRLRLYALGIDSDPFRYSSCRSCKSFNSKESHSGLTKTFLAV